MHKYSLQRTFVGLTQQRQSISPTLDPHHRITDQEYVFSTGLLYNDRQDRRPSRGDRTLRYLCYGLHVFLIVLHTVLVGMLFTHPEHHFSVSINNTTATIALKAFLQAFYSVRLLTRSVAT